METRAVVLLEGAQFSDFLVLVSSDGCSSCRCNHFMQKYQPLYFTRQGMLINFLDPRTRIMLIGFYVVDQAINRRWEIDWCTVDMYW